MSCLAARLDFPPGQILISISISPQKHGFMPCNWRHRSWPHWPRQIIWIKIPFVHEAPKASEIGSMINLAIECSTRNASLILIKIFKHQKLITKKTIRERKLFNNPEWPHGKGVHHGVPKALPSWESLKRFRDQQEGHNAAMCWSPPAKCFGFNLFWLAGHQPFFSSSYKFCTSVFLHLLLGFQWHGELWRDSSIQILADSCTINGNAPSLKQVPAHSHSRPLKNWGFQGDSQDTHVQSCTPSQSLAQTY